MRVTYVTNSVRLKRGPLYLWMRLMTCSRPKQRNTRSDGAIAEIVLVTITDCDFDTRPHPQIDGLKSSTGGSKIIPLGATNQPDVGHLQVVR